MDMPISSQASKEEGSEVSGLPCRRLQVQSKRPTPNCWGDDMIQSSWKREAALNKLMSKRHISAEGCWEWTGSKTVGYGTLKLPKIWGNFKILAHRLAWVVFNKQPIEDGLFVCHKCDNPKCFNPEHLFLGTQKDNLMDCSKKGRTMTGSKNGNSKYVEADIQKVKELLAQGCTGKETSLITGVSRTHVSRIKRGTTWSLSTKKTANTAHGLAKHSEKQLVKAAKLIAEGRLTLVEVAKLTEVALNTVKDMKRGKVHKLIMARYMSNDHV